MSKTHTFYLPTFLRNKGDDTRCMLIVRKYQRYKAKSGKFVTKYAMDAVEYPNEQAMAAAIEAEHMQELPGEAEGDTAYIPPKLRSGINRRVQKL